MNPGLRRALVLVLIFLGVFLTIRFLLPIFLPFLLGAGLAFAAEPIVRFLNTRLRMPRPLAAGLGVGMSFCFLAFIVLVLCGLLIRELGSLAGVLPELEEAARAGMTSLSDFLLELARKAPDGIRTLVTQNVTDLFSGGSALLDKVTGWLLSLASGILSRVPDRFLSIGTGIIASFMISAKLPKLTEAIRSRLPLDRLKPYFASLSRLKTALCGWLKAQAKLCGITWVVVTLGFVVLRIPYAPLWALLVALVDALPVLGSGVILLPWGLVSFLQGDRLQGIGLLATYAAAALTRSVLEPRLVGRQLGLDPLVTLVALYAGYRLWGLGGMLLAPMLAVAATQLAEAKKDPPS